MNGCHCAGNCNSILGPVSDLVQEGRESLRAHIVNRADAARAKYGTLNEETLPQYLGDRAFVRRPTRLVFEFGELAAHQFGDPEPDPRDPENSVVLYLRPVLRQRPDLVVLAAAYLIPVINYGEMALDGDCLANGAILLGLSEQEYYARLCKLAEYVGAEECFEPSEGGGPRP